MKRSDQTDLLFTALAKAQGEMSAVPFDSSNPHFRAKYASLAKIQEVVRSPLATNGLTVIQTIESHEDGSPWVETLLGHTSGQFITSALKLILNKSDMQNLGSATTYAKRYCLCAMLGISGDNDDDGNLASKPLESFSSIPKAVMDKAREMGNGQTISVTNLAKSINEINDWPPPKEEFAEAAQAWPETNPDVTIANIAGSAQYKVEFGKYLGKSLEEMGPAQVQSYVDWWSRKLKEDGKEAQGKVREFLTHANLFLKANPDVSVPF